MPKFPISPCTFTSVLDTIFDASWITRVPERSSLKASAAACTLLLVADKNPGALLVNLRKVFGEMRLADVEPQHIYRYADTRVDRKGKKSPSTARHELSVFEHAFSKTVEWGLIAHHPIKGQVRLKGSKPRTRYHARGTSRTGRSSRPCRSSRLARAARCG